MQMTVFLFWRNMAIMCRVRWWNDPVEKNGVSCTFVWTMIDFPFMRKIWPLVFEYPWIMGGESINVILKNTDSIRVDYVVSYDLGLKNFSQNIEFISISLRCYNMFYEHSRNTYSIFWMRPWISVNRRPDGFFIWYFRKRVGFAINCCQNHKAGV